MECLVKTDSILFFVPKSTHGVRKTALVYGLAARIEAGNVPERLTGCRIYELDLGLSLIHI